MGLQSTTTVYIGGKQINTCQQSNIKQSIGKHHTFYVVLSLDSIEQKESQITINSQEYLGENIIINTSADVDSDNQNETFEFTGIITQVQSRKTDRDLVTNELVLSGFSTTIITDDGINYNSFLQMSFTDIISNVFQNYDQSKLKINSNPINDNTIAYSVQNKESAFAYISRLAAQQGEWFYYNGKQLCIGKENISEPIVLVHPINLKEYAISLNPTPTKYKTFTNDYLNDQTVEYTDKDINVTVSGLNQFTANKSDEIYDKETSLFVNTFDDTELNNRVQSSATITKNALIARQVKITGSSDHPSLFIGQVIKVNDEKVNQGSFRITSVEHRANDNGDYINVFEGINADCEGYPLSNINAFPHSETQVAKVFDNVDPDGLSRVQVQFPWQVTENQTTPWIRVLTPHSGSDKGFHFIPEVGEEVLVGFEGGNAERPYVMGALYNGQNKPEEFQTDANDQKVIRTRSGHTIELNDTEGEEKINIYDNEGSIITFDTQAKSLTINATETIDIAAKNINIVAEKNINIQAQGNIAKAAEGDISIQAQGAIDVQATGDASLTSSGAVAVEATSDATLKGANAVVSGQASAELSGAQAKVAGSAMTEVSGGIVKVN